MVLPPGAPEGPHEQAIRSHRHPPDPFFVAALPCHLIGLSVKSSVRWSSPPAVGSLSLEEAALNSVEEALQRPNDRAVHAIVHRRLSTVGALVCGGGALGHIVWNGPRPVFQLSLAAGGLFLIAVGRLKFLTSSIRNAAFILCLAVQTLLVLHQAGYTPAFTVSYILMATVAGLLSGRLAFGASCVALPVVFVLVGHGVESGWIRFPIAGRNANLFSNWVRAALFYSAVLTCLTGTIAGVSRYITQTNLRLRQRQLEVESSRKAMFAVRAARLSAEQEVRRGLQLESMARIERGLAQHFQSVLLRVRSLVESLSPAAPIALRQTVSQAVQNALTPSLQLIDDLMTLNRPPTRNPASTTKLQSLIETTCRSIAVAPVGAKTMIQTRLGPELEVVGPRELFQQAIFNLLFNATEATSPGCVRVSTAYAKPIDGQHTHALVMVEDTGEGIDEADLVRAVEPFFTTRSGQTGLGLSVVHAIAVQTGGWFELRSTSGRGTCAALALPLARPVSTESVREVDVAPTGKELYPPGELTGLSDRYTLPPVPTQAMPSIVELSTWRLDFARRLCRAISLFTCLLLLIHFWVAPPLHVITYIAVAVGLLGIGWTGWFATASPAVTFGMLLYGTFGASLVSLLANSYDNPVAVTGLTIAFCWSVLLGQARATWVMLVTFVVSFLATGWVREAYWPVPMLDNLDVNNGETWYRIAPQIFLQLLVLGATVFGVLERLKLAAQDRAVALELAEALRLHEAREAGQLVALKAHQALQERLHVTGQLAASLAHDLRNTLQLIFNIQLIEEEMTEDAVAELLLDVRTGLADAETLARQLKADTSSVNQRCDLTEHVRSVIRQLTQSAPDTISLTMQLDECGDVQLSATKIRRVVTNLFMNSRDAMPMGGQITVVLRRESQTAVLTIQDTGAGMEPLVADRVFDAYFSTKTVKGHGLGLHAVRQIMTSCGGQISLQSAVGRGSMFKLAFPLKTPLLDELSAASDV